MWKPVVLPDAFDIVTARSPAARGAQVELTCRSIFSQNKHNAMMQNDDTTPPAPEEKPAEQQ
jgi:hypothetical protein